MCLPTVEGFLFPIAGQLISQEQFEQGIAGTRAADTFKSSASALFALANLLPVYAPMIAVVEYNCEPVARATEVSGGRAGGSPHFPNVSHTLGVRCQTRSMPPRQHSWSTSWRTVQ